jgi:hemerythrin-like domain-containing protein
MAVNVQKGRNSHFVPPPPLPRNFTDPIDFLVHEHARQEWLCDVLETIADGLPGTLECALAAMVADALKVDVPLHHEDEEQGLFPLLQRRAVPEDNIEAMIRQLNREHLADDTYSTDLIDLLDALAGGQIPVNPEMAGYMIRGFFESYRRHIAFENIVIMPLARVRLTPEDMQELLARIRSRRHKLAMERS